MDTSNGYRSGQVNQDWPRWRWLLTRGHIIVLVIALSIASVRAMMLWLPGWPFALRWGLNLSEPAFTCEMAILGLPHFIGLFFWGMFRGCSVLRFVAVMLGYPICATVLVLPGLYLSSVSKGRKRALLLSSYVVVVMIVNLLIGRYLLPSVVPSM